MDLIREFKLEIKVFIPFGFVHKNIPNSIKALKEICKAENIKAEASEDPTLFTDENLSTLYDVKFSSLKVQYD